ncbi:hypothetical protein H2199_002330 [Coniosporium tulheliwenetii]|uniref:Uncharacterized protein n=1 Tax=Coniosporium tulheliwenetii TaxID=3383036 RepID=A0ACC2ZIG4_9PEZI|nr:hypothetical protein H2199_002330 [Cladosporium sp. JES 115]
MNSQNQHTANLDIDMDLGTDFSSAGPGTLGQNQYAAIAGQNGGIQSFSNRNVTMGGRAKIVIDPALLALDATGETFNPAANAPQVHGTEDNSFWAIYGADTNFGFNAAGQGLNNNFDALVSPFNTGTYQSRHPEVPDSSFNATAHAGSNGPHLGETPGISTPYFVGPPQFTADHTNTDPSPDTDMETELPGFTNFAVGYEAGYQDATAAALAKPPSLPAPTDALLTVVARLLHPPREATWKNGHLERRWLAQTFPEHFPQYGGYRLRKKSPLWKYGAEALGIPPRYWQWLNGGLIDYSVQELEGDVAEMGGLVPAVGGEADQAMETEEVDGSVAAAEAALAEAFNVQPPASTNPRNEVEVSPEIQAVVTRMLAPDDKAFWHQSGRFKRSWLAKEFPKHFRRNDHHLKPRSILRAYGPEKLGIPEELWRFLTGELEIYVWPGRENLDRRIRKKKGAEDEEIL